MTSKLSEALAALEGIKARQQVVENWHRFVHDWLWYAKERATDDMAWPNEYVIDAGRIARQADERARTDIPLLVAALEEAGRATRTRPDYDLRCQDCGAAHNVDTSIPSAIWNAICENRNGVAGAAAISMPEVGVLCTICIDERLVKAGLTCNAAEFYYTGTALRSRLYGETSNGHYEDKLRQAIARAEAAEARIGDLERGQEARIADNLRILGQHERLSVKLSDALSRQELAARSSGELTRKLQGAEIVIAQSEAEVARLLKMIDDDNAHWADESAARPKGDDDGD